ncbi:unnamed protein product [marine sediment metagenome]|uniref:Uncharacterized protein n=1 Tax=marine sediment metagenome TaxID=412755 RepID=X1PFZ2_9ZZZZ
MLIIGVLFLVIGGGLGIAFIFLVNAILGVSVGLCSYPLTPPKIWLSLRHD